MLDHHHIHLRQTFSLALESVSRGDHPFGAILVLDDKIVEVGLNTVNSENNVTAHAELNLIAKLGTYSQEELKRSILYSSTEPCAMCTGAIAWSGIRNVVYGCSASRLQEIAKSHFMIESREILKHSNEEFIIQGPLLLEEAAKIHEKYW